MAPKLIVILRHAEKPGDPEAPDSAADPDLSPVGQQRAAMLKMRIPEICAGPPDFVFAAANSDKSHRPAETMEPLASTLPPERFIATIPNGKFLDLAHDLLTDPGFQNKIVVVCWHHGNIPALAAALGVNEAQMRTAPEYRQGKWSGKVFDRFWILTFPVSGGVRFQSAPQAAGN